MVAADPFQLSQAVEHAQIDVVRIQLGNVRLAHLTIRDVLGDVDGRQLDRRPFAGRIGERHRFRH